MAAQGSKYGFSHLDCQDKLGKLKRELTRMRRIRHNADILTDHTENFCYTAWHLTEWIWGAYFEQDERFWGAFSRGLGLVNKGSSEPIGQYRNYLARSCKELAYCRVVATGAKHFSYTNSNPAVVATGMDVTNYPPYVIELDLFTKGGRPLTVSLQPRPLHTPKLRLPDGQLVDVFDIFPPVLKFLTNFLNDVEAAANTPE